MELGFIDEAFFAGRFKYLSMKLEGLPDARFGTKLGREIIRVNTSDPDTGKVITRRLSHSNPGWPDLSKIASQRAFLERQLKCLKEQWSMYFRGSLEHASSKYILMPNIHNPYNSDFWNALVEDDCDIPKDYPVNYKGMVMRSQFEVETAKILDSLGIEYKYEVRLKVGSNYYLYPDMGINLPEFNRCGFVEVMGGLDNFRYITSNTNKIKNYMNIGLYPNRDIALICGDQNYRPDPLMIKRIIGTMLSSIAVSHVYKKE